MLAKVVRLNFGSVSETIRLILNVCVNCFVFLIEILYHKVIPIIYFEIALSKLVKCYWIKLFSRVSSYILVLMPNILYILLSSRLGVLTLRVNFIILWETRPTS